MKKFLYLILMFFGFVVFAGFWFYQNIKPVSATESFKDFLIVKGSGAIQIGNKLEKEGLIKSALAFKVYVQVTSASSKILAGEYRLSPNMSLLEVVGQLKRGPAEIWVTIPEGLRREEVASKFTSALGKDENFKKEFLAISDGEEGYLFPDTYLFPKTASASAIVNKMTSTFESVTKDLNLTSDQVILASLIERETKTNEERPVVAGILMNRLDIGMALQVDATLQYVKGTWGVVTTADKSLNSPYNTYKFASLPPGPIANPGLSSLKAAANPADTEYFYYLHDSKGNIYYAETLDEHDENIRKYLTD
jgi:UPF0755 protein